MPAHTPGPWAVAASRHIMADPSRDGRQVASVDPYEFSPETRAANAALIAAAPMMLHELRRIVACLSQPVQTTDLAGADTHRLIGAAGILRCDARVAREIAEAAIDQAEGRAS